MPGSNHSLYYFIYPSYRVNHFVPRTHPQKEIRKYLQAPRTTIMPTIIVLLGIGGCGKSQLALEYCQQSEKNKSYHAIFWINALSPTTIEQSLTRLARELPKPGFNVKDIEGNVRFVLKTITASLGPGYLFSIILTIFNHLVARILKSTSHGAIKDPSLSLAEIEWQEG